MATEEELKKVLADLHGENPDGDVILVSHEISRSLYYKLSGMLGNEKRGRQKCVVFLNTLGGDPHAAFRIARCLRYHYKAVRLVVPHVCKSAGTLIAIGADTVVIGDMGELGPLDVQISNRKELFEQSSGLDYTEALRALDEHAQSTFRQGIIEIRAGAQISTKMAGEFASSLAVGSVAPMYAQIDPIQVGEVYRAMKIAHEYGRRLNDQSKQLKAEAILQLVSGYPDHSFVIDRKEAEGLFRSVEAPTAHEQAFATTFWSVLRHESGKCVVFDATSPNTGEPHGSPAASPEADAANDDAGRAIADSPETGDRSPSEVEKAGSAGEGSDTSVAAVAAEPTAA